MKLPKVKCTIRTIYHFDFLGVCLGVEFVRVKNVPGYSHKVLVNGAKAGWLSNEFKPSVKTAMYYYQKAATVVNAQNNEA